MKQLLQNLKNGELVLAELPVPGLKAGAVLIRSRLSLVSIGTEKMLLEFGRSNVWTKAKKQPDKVRQVLQKIKTDGLFKTLEAVQSKLDTPIPLGYSNVGVVVAVGAGVEGLLPGDRVVSNGPHAEFVVVPHHLVAKIPDPVSDQSAAFTVTASIALQGIRLLQPQLGETVAVIGLGLIGLITVQLLQANGCRVIGYDFDQKKLDLAASWGITVVNLGKTQRPETIVEQLTHHKGVDGVLITASTNSNDPLHLAATISRQRGKVVLVGVVGNQWSRDDFYKKELSFQVSCSYGPGRYDPLYEERGQDYPFAHVRWTEHRNFKAILDLLENKTLQFEQFVDQSLPFADAEKAYTQILAQSSLIGVIFEYPTTPVETPKTIALRSTLPLPTPRLHIGFIGAGNFSKAVLLPELSRLQKAHHAQLRGIVSQTGISAHHLGKKFGFYTQYATTQDLLADEQINVVFITTQHHQHADQVKAALIAGKHVFVEKPLCLTTTELDEIEALHQANPSLQILVGFNRRFSPHIQHIKRHLPVGGPPVSITMTINAGKIPMDHWTQQSDRGGGRIVGEGVHFIDLARYLASAPIQSFQVFAMDQTKDVVTVQLSFANGSIATIHYWANGNNGYPKEKLTLFSAGKIFELDNFRRLTTHGVGSGLKTFTQNKGHATMLDAWLSALREGQASPIPFDEIVEVSRVAIEAQQALG